MVFDLDETQLEEVFKDPEKLRKLAKDLRTKADQLDALAAGETAEVEGMWCTPGCITRQAKGI